MPMKGWLAAVAAVAAPHAQPAIPVEPPMSEPGESDARTLAELRAEIDRIDEAMHRLLMQRGTVIDALILAKGTARPGAAFRPQREAEMMRRLVARHAGRLPLATAEHLWREIIATFTHMQAGYSVVVEDGNPTLRDLARFYFGFTVALTARPDAAAVVAAVATEGSALGVVALPNEPAAAPWWRALGDGARVIALLPFIRVAGRPADGPALVVGPPVADPTPPDLPVVALHAEGIGLDALAREGLVAILAESPSPNGREVLAATAPQLSVGDLEAMGCRNISATGGIARGVAVGMSSTLLYAAAEVPAEQAKEPK